MKKIYAKTVEDVLEILKRNADENTDFDLENPNNPNDSQIIEYDLNGNSDPIYWSLEKIYENNKRVFCLFC